LEHLKEEISGGPSKSKTFREIEEAEDSQLLADEDHEISSYHKSDGNSKICKICEYYGCDGSCIKDAQDKAFISKFEGKNEVPVGRPTKTIRVKQKSCLKNEKMEYGKEFLVLW